jgi:hypothetical protein
MCVAVSNHERLFWCRKKTSKDGKTTRDYGITVAYSLFTVQYRYVRWKRWFTVEITSTHGMISHCSVQELLCIAYGGLLFPPPKDIFFGNSQCRVSRGAAMGAHPERSPNQARQEHAQSHISSARGCQTFVSVPVNRHSWEGTISLLF